MSWCSDKFHWTGQWLANCWLHSDWPINLPWLHVLLLSPGQRDIGYAESCDCNLWTCCSSFPWHCVFPWSPIEWTAWGWTGQWRIHRVCKRTRNEVDRPRPAEPPWKHTQHWKLRDSNCKLHPPPINSTIHLATTKTALLQNKQVSKHNCDSSALYPN